MRKTIISLLFILVHLSSIYSQKSLISFPSPEAAELGKYGQIPVSYFNGLPEISIPLYTVQCKDISLPISLSYHAAGNKPDEHPTWVGLGWNLNCGGMITRVTNTLRDEMTIADLSRETGYGLKVNPGYYYRADEFTNDDWSNNTSSLLTKMLSDDASYTMLDSEPDEFIFNFCGHSGSFYFVSENGQIKAKVKSKDGDMLNVKVDFFPANGTDCPVFEDIATYDTSSDKFTIYKTFKKFTVTTRDGFIYEFGGDISSIDFTSTSLLKTNSTSWHLTKITSPNGNNITLNYKKGGNVFIQRKSNYYYAVFSPQDPNNAVGTPSDNSSYDGLSVTIIHPKYLSSINTSVGQSINFISSKTTELDYNNWSTINYPYRKNLISDNTGEAVNFDWNNDISIVSYYLKLDRIEMSNLKNINLFYSNSSTQRLHLLGLSTTPINTVPANITDNTNQQKYIFSYNSTALPAYNARMSDNWGYFNNKDYSSLKYNKYSTMYDFRSPDEQYCKAEILENITYPTGGSTSFDYELNQYSKIVSGQDFTTSLFLLSNSAGNAGGLRIKSITDYYDPNDNTKKTSKTFSYLNADGTTSSGILSGKPIYSLSGKNHISYSQGAWIGFSHWTESADYDLVYNMYSQNQLLPLSNTNGNHITYSRVIEQENNGSKTIYTYSNHDEFPDEMPIVVATNMDNILLPSFTSKELERGLLKNVQMYNGSNIVKNIDYAYNDDNARYNNYIKSINKYILAYCSLGQYSLNKIYAFYPFLKSKTETLYNIDGTNSVSKTTEYTYNNYNLQSSVSETGSKSSSDKTYIVTKYPFDISTSPYTSMTDSFMLNYPIEEIKYKGTNVVSGHLTTYKSISTTSGTLYKPDKVYSVEQTSPLGSFNFYDGTQMDSHYGQSDISYLNYDQLGNLTEAQDKTGLHTAYLWGYNYQYPIAAIKNSTYALVSAALQGITTDQLASVKIPDMTSVDALRSKLPNSLISTYTYKPNVGIIRSTDPKGITMQYEYNSLSQLSNMLDADNNILTRYLYAYQNSSQIGDLSYNTLSASIITNSSSYQISNNGTANLEISGGSGYCSYKWTLSNSAGTILQSSNSDTFTFNCSQAGTLTISCSITDIISKSNISSSKTITSIDPCAQCTGTKYKCINNNCEVGDKVYTSSTRISTNPIRYRCIYHYEWSDGSFSSNYTETNSSSCDL